MSASFSQTAISAIANDVEMVSAPETTASVDMEKETSETAHAQSQLAFNEVEKGESRESVVEEKATESTEISPASYFWDYNDLQVIKYLNIDSCPPRPLATSTSREFSAQNILKGCKWAPDGSCLLTNSDDNLLRIFNLPSSILNTQYHEIPDKSNVDSAEVVEIEQLNPSLHIKEGSSVYDYSWYPHMNSMDPATCCFISTAADNPIHLFDAFDGRLRATYLTFNHLELIISPHAVEFDLTGNYIYAGFKDSIKIFNIERPGRDFIERKLKSSVLPDLNLSGIVSCFAFHPTYSSTLYACGSYQNNIGLYLEDGTVMAVLTGHLGGVTQLKFSHDGTKLISGARKDSRLIVWDIRNLGDVYEVLNREVDTNQRIYFDITKNDRYLVSGQTNGQVSIWDLNSSGCKETDKSTQNLLTTTQTHFRVSKDCVNGVSINPFIPVLATATGQRHFLDLAEDDCSDQLFTKSQHPQDHAVKLWKFV